MKNYKTYNLSILVLLVTILLLQGCDQTVTTPNSRTQETSTRITGIKRKAPIEVELVSEEELKDIELAMNMAEKKAKQTPAQNVATSVDDANEEKKGCGCSRTFHEYSSFPGGYHSYYTCPYHQKKEQDERNKKQKIVTEHKAILKTITTKNMIPVSHAIEKYRKYCPNLSNNDTYIRKNCLDHDVLEITKKSNKWVCSKERVDAVDFALLDGHVDTTASTMWGGWRELRGK